MKNGEVSEEVSEEGARGKIPERDFADSWKRYWRIVGRIAPGAISPEDLFIDRLGSTSTNGKWLDAGCGRQSYPNWRRDAYQSFIEAGGSHFGCDLDLDALRESEIPGRVCQATLDQIPFASESFDQVSSNMVFEHLTDPEDVVRELVRVTAPGGRILVHTVNALHYSAWVAHLTPQWFHEWFVVSVEGRAPKDVYPTQYRANTVGRLQKLFEDAGAQMTWGGETQGIPIHFPYPVLFWAGIALGVVERWIARVPLLGRFLRPNLLMEFQRPDSPDRREASVGDRPASLRLD